MLKLIDMPEVGEIARVDELGRVTVPITLRRIYDIETKGYVEVFPTKEGIVIRNPKTHEQKKEEYGMMQCKIEETIKKYIKDIGEGETI